MSRFTYYSPVLYGVVLVLVFQRALMTAAETQLHAEEMWQKYAALVLAALGAGVIAQLGLVAFQGAFAQVLPVPSGRSIRGTNAARAGWLAIGSLVLVCAWAVLWFQGVGFGAVLAGGGALASLAGAVIIYIWSLPAAVADFPAGDFD